MCHPLGQAMESKSYETYLRKVWHFALQTNILNNKGTLSIPIRIVWPVWGTETASFLLFIACSYKKKKLNEVKTVWEDWKN